MIGKWMIGKEWRMNCVNFRWLRLGLRRRLRQTCAWALASHLSLRPEPRELRQTFSPSPFTPPLPPPFAYPATRRRSASCVRVVRSIAVAAAFRHERT